MDKLQKIFFLLWFSPLAFASDNLTQPEVRSALQNQSLVIGKHSMIVTNNPWSSRAAKQILDNGGSATDAAISAAFVLGLTEPQSSGIGGGGYALTYNSKTKTMVAFDGREIAPATANPSWFLDKNGQPLDFKVAYKTPLAVGVPSEVALLRHMWQKNGKLAWATLLKPAIELATSGFRISPRLYGLLKSEEKELSQVSGFKDIYFTAEGKVKPIGTLVTNPKLAQSLKRIAKNPDDFYNGQLAKDIVNAINSKAQKPIYQLSDLSRYKIVTHPPVCVNYRQKYKICSVPPSTSGGVTMEELMLIYSKVYSSSDINNSNWSYYFLEAAKLAYADRDQYIADPAFIAQPIAGLLANDYITDRAKLISAKALPNPVIPGIPKGANKAHIPDNSIKAPGTTSLAIVDKNGNAISMTVTIEYQFGSHIFVDGFLLNNELTDFSFIPNKDGIPVANRVQAFKRPRSSITPTMVFSPNGELKIVAGSPGGSQIICYVARNLIAMLDFGLDPVQATSGGNLCISRGSSVAIESDSNLMTLIPMLQKRGESVDIQSLVSGEVNIKHTANGYEGGADPRREGLAIGGD
ncbi:MAG: gamma-glutamyltransferase family protein [Burkholderiales bacterium]|nr:gamma-glutamyltransferase family protein [Burkholderiales bacterium]